MKNFDNDGNERAPLTENQEQSDEDIFQDMWDEDGNVTVNKAEQRKQRKASKQAEKIKKWLEQAKALTINKIGGIFQEELEVYQNQKKRHKKSTNAQKITA